MKKDMLRLRATYHICIVYPTYKKYLYLFSAQIYIFQKRLNSYDISKLVQEKIREQAIVIALDKPAVALQWYDMIFEKIFSLDAMPDRCPEAPENQYFTYAVRQLLIGEYRVLFRIVSDTVRILDFKG